jgi:hypothetical protein
LNFDCISWPGFNTWWGERDFALLCSIKTSSGAHAASYSVGTRGSFPRSKEAMAWGRPLTSIYCWGQEWWHYTFTPSYFFMAWCWIKYAQAQIYLYLLPFLGNKFLEIWNHMDPKPRQFGGNLKPHSTSLINQEFNQIFIHLPV